MDEPRLRWFDLAGDRELSPDAAGVVRVRQFPSLWIDTAALAARDHGRLLTTLEQGLATPEHAEFVRTLAGRHGGG